MEKVGRILKAGLTSLVAVATIALSTQDAEAGQRFHRQRGFSHHDLGHHGYGHHRDFGYQFRHGRVHGALEREHFFGHLDLGFDHMLGHAFGTGRNPSLHGLQHYDLGRRHFSGHIGLGIDHGRWHYYNDSPPYRHRGRW